MSGKLLVCRKRSVFYYEEDVEITAPPTSKRFRTYHANSPIHSSPTTILAEPNPNPEPHAAANIPVPVPVNGCEWVEFLLREMQNSSDMDDARLRVSTSLELLEKTILSRTAGDFTNVESLQQENAVLREQVESVSHQNSILKRAVVIQHQHQTEHEERVHELQRVKELVSQSEEQIRVSQVDNYALTLQLRQAQASTPNRGGFHPHLL